MQKNSFIKLCLITGLLTAAVIALYETSDQLLVYRFFRFEYYVAGITIAALATGIILATQYHKNKAGINPVEDGVNKLTAKETRILEQICAGRSNKEIAALNFIELSTVKTHINNIYGKMGAKNRKEVIRLHQTHVEKQKSTLSPPAII